MFNKKIVLSIIFLVSFFSAIVGLNQYGKSRRISLREKTVLTADSPDKIYEIWAAKKIRGRTLLLFGNYPHLTRSSDYVGVRQLTALNFVEFSAFNNLVRRIYMIVPEDRWEEIRTKPSIGVIRTVPGMERGLYLYNLVGIPIVATTPSSLPPLSETALVYINRALFEESYVQNLLASKGIDADIIVLYGGH